MDRLLTLPKLIEITVDDAGEPTALRIDGQTFPWFLTPGCDIHLRSHDESLSTVTVTIYAERIQINTHPPRSC